ncbi:AAA family ATPase [Actinokineospora sp. 24-640]
MINAAPFVGAERHREVERLTEAFAMVASSGEARMVAYVGPPGWGKTRIVQEFYAELAAGQRYWPASLTPVVGPGAGALAELTATRKAVRHQAFTPPPEAEIPWLWLAPATGRISDGTPAPALADVATQLTRAVPALLARRAAAGLPTDDVLAEIVRTLPLADVIGMAGVLGGRVVELAFGQHQTLPEGSMAGRLSALLGTLTAGLPIVLVLDDAHDLDQATVDFLGETLASDLPVLVLATTWPEHLVVDDARSPFADYLASAGHGDRYSRISLGRLNDDDLVECIAGEYPATDPQILTGLARRADGNPYSLRLLLNTPRVVSSAADGRLGLTAAEVDSLSSGLERLISELWAQLPVGVRQILVAASMLGSSFHEQVLEEALRPITPSAGLDQARSSAWIQPAGAIGLMEFIERIRWEVAKVDGPNVLSATDQAEVRRGALRATRMLLAGDLPDSARLVLLTLRVDLADAAVAEDLAGAADSAVELADRAIEESRRSDAIRYLRKAIGWYDSVTPLPSARLGSALSTVSGLLRAEYGRETAEPIARRAVAVLGPLGDRDLLAQARAELVLTLLRRGQAAAEEATTLLAETRRSVDETALSPLAQVKLAEATMVRHAGLGDRLRALECARERAALSEEHFGAHHRHTLSALADVAFNAMRIGDVPQSVAIRRDLLVRRQALAGVLGVLQTSSGSHNLVASLLELDDDSVVDEALDLAEEAVLLRSRAFGLDGRLTLSSRLNRSRAYYRRGLARERAGDDASARADFSTACAESARVVELRAGAEPASRAIALQRNGIARACLRDMSGLSVIGEALSIRQLELRQDRTFWEVRRVAVALRWAYLRFGRGAEAASIAERYGLDDPDTVVPTAV